MSKNKTKDERPQSTEAFGHPVMRGVKDVSSDHKPGFEDSPRPARGAAAAREKATGAGAVLPPSKAGKSPRSSLAERLRQRLSEKEEK
jgi:hypothetical protein